MATRDLVAIFLVKILRWSYDKRPRDINYIINIEKTMSLPYFRPSSVIK